MPHIEILDSGYVDRADAAFATLVRLDKGEIVCGFSRGGGPYATGDTHCARSVDGGRTWAYQGVILARETDPLRTNHLRLSRTGAGVILAYGQRDQREQTEDGLVTVRSEPVVCRSADGGQTWSAAEVIPFQIEGPYEISNPIVVTADGRQLAPYVHCVPGPRHRHWLSGAEAERVPAGAAARLRLGAGLRPRYRPEKRL